MIYDYMIYDILRDDYNRRQLERVKLPENILHVTEIINPCHAKVFYDRHIKYMELKQGFINVVEHGNIIHDWIVAQFTMKEPNRFVGEGEVEKKTIYGYGVYGKIDLYDLKNNAVIEIKTVSPQGFKHKEKEANYTYIWQVQLYMWLMDTDMGVIEMISRSNYRDIIDLEVKEFDVYRDNETIKKLLRKGEVIYKMLKGELPITGVYRVGEYLEKVGLIRDREHFSWMCKYCIYSDICRYKDRV